MPTNAAVAAPAIMQTVFCSAFGKNRSTASFTLIAIVFDCTSGVPTEEASSPKSAKPAARGFETDCRKRLPVLLFLKPFSI